MLYLKNKLFLFFKKCNRVFIKHAICLDECTFRIHETMIHLVMWRLTASASQYSDWLEILTFLCFPSVQNRFKNFESSTSFFKMGPATLWNYR